MSAPEQPSLLAETDRPDYAPEATAAAVSVLLAYGGHSESIAVPGKAAPGGSKSAFVVPVGAPIKSLRGHRPFTVGVADRKGVFRYGRPNVVDANEKALRPWQQVVRSNAQAQRGPGPPLEGALAIVARFEEVRPKSHYRTGRSTSHLLAKGKPQRRTMMPDATKLLRGFEDALTGIVWADDAQIVWQLVEKVYGREDVATITVVELGPA